MKGENQKKEGEILARCSLVFLFFNSGILINLPFDVYSISVSNQAPYKGHYCYDTGLKLPFLYV